MILRALVALALLLVGVLALLDIGGTAADAAGLLAIVAALLTFDYAVFRIGEARPKPDEREPDEPRLR
jgi:hypothetical protein